jgi:3-oxoacyl-[acyl-carrier protein] reductase
MTEMTGKAALVTGGNSGIGRAIAGALAAAGARVAIVGRREQVNRETVAELKEKHPSAEAIAIATDVSIEEDCVRAVRETRERLGGFDILVNNAGIGGGDKIAETSTEDFDRVLKTNLYGAFWCAREAFRVMVKNPETDGLRGNIINVSSLAGKEAWSGTGAYSVSKFGMMALTQSLADEGKAAGIRATAICPALVATPMTGASGTDVIRPDDIAATVLYLLRLSSAVWPTEIVLPRRGAE